ncbi:MAG: transglutaminase domain-containing protein, partial [Oscillospiraceae bacterium]|nr:transglutaminase domain-containing protein [Oscillospiraceae bacterium]
DMQCESLFYNTRYIFSPAKIRLESTIRKNLDMRKKDIDIKVKDMGISEKDGSIVTDMKLGYRDGYYVSCYVVNHGGRVMERLAENASPISEEEWEQTARNETVFGKDGFTYADLQSYHREVYEKYCRPCGVSDRVRELLDGIQEGAVTRYDTAARLQTYLSSMDYDAECGPLPDTVTDGRSFLDYFLLQSRRGYCMHYATAFVLMANEMGIPCRYVQGFNVRRENGAMIVRQSSAHAWPEVYFDDVGWIAFEPTPGFAVPTGWDVAERETDDIPDVPEPVTVDLPSLDYEEPIVEEKRIDPLIFIIPSLAVMVFLIAFYLISRAVSRRMYSRMSLCDRCRYTARQSIRILGILGFGMEEGETLAELRDRIAQSDRQDVSSLTGFIPIYEDVLYSERELTEEDAGTAEDMNIRLRALAKKGGLRSRILLMIRDR